MEPVPALPAPNPAPVMLPIPMPDTPVNHAQAERKTAHLVHSLMEYCRLIGLSLPTLATKSGVNIWTLRNLNAGLKHRKVKNYPNLLTFVKLLGAADLEIQIVRAQQGLIPDDPMSDPQPPPYYNTGTEGTVKWRPPHQTPPTDRL